MTRQQILDSLKETDLTKTIKQIGQGINWKDEYKIDVSDNQETEKCLCSKCNQWYEKDTFHRCENQ